MRCCETGLGPDSDDVAQDAPTRNAQKLCSIQARATAVEWSLELFGDRAGDGPADVWDPEHFRHGNYIAL
jgi:hypothetical protein